MLQILALPTDEKRPFDNIYAAVELLRPLAYETPTTTSGYCAAVYAARMCYDSLEFSQMRNFLALATKFEQLGAEESYRVVTLYQFCTKYPFLAPIALKLRGTYALYFCNYQQFEEALTPLLDCEKAANAVLELELDVVDVFFDEIDFEKANDSTVAKRTLYDELIHCLFYAAYICYNLDMRAESAAFCRKCLLLQLQCTQYNVFEWVKQATDLYRYYAIHCDWTNAHEFLLQAAKLAVKAVRDAHDNTCEDELKDDDIDKENADMLLNLWGLLMRERATIAVMAESKKESLLQYLFGSAETCAYLFAHCYAAGFRCCSYGIYEIGTLFYSANEPHKLDKISNGLLVRMLDACDEFLNIAEEFYVLDGFVTMHVNIKLAASHLLQLRAKFFENSKELQERRIQVLRPLILKINPQHFPRIYEELLVELSEARYEIFTHIYDTQPANNQLVASCGAASIDYYQTYVKYLEGGAFARAKIELKKEQPSFDDWVGYISDDSIETYIDACFNQSVIFSKFPFYKKQMMQNALNGFTFCEKLWRAFKERVDGDFEENLKLVAEMRTLMYLRISQME